ncbi:MAG: hypothetical protein CSA26_09645 [Desulfobacterales bacterium]|nr:MAG: hypothetical protein CSA26_09645 [Desulfobacterales bacterium]
MTEKENGSSLEASEPPSKKGIFRRFFERISLGRSPDTKEALEHEIQGLLEEGEEQGLISSMEEQMISSIFDFRETLVSEVMTPAAEIISLDVATSVSDITAKIIEVGFTRIPIYQDNPDQVLGILHAKDLLRIISTFGSETIDLRQFLKPAEYVRENTPIVELLRDFQKKKNHMVLVTDEFGAVRGLATLEDILEEIVGEIDDEYDVEEVDLEVLDSDTIRVKGKIDIDAVEETFNVQFPDGPYESIGGLVTHSLGRIGEVGETAEIAGLVFTIENATPRAIESLQIKRKNVEEE